MIAGFGAAVASSVSAAPGVDAALSTDSTASVAQDAATVAKPEAHVHARLRGGGDRFAALLAAAAPADSAATALAPAAGTGETVAEASANSESVAAADAVLPELLLALIGMTPLAGQPAATPAVMPTTAAMSALPAEGAASPSTAHAAVGVAGSGAAAAALDVAATLSEDIGPDPAAANMASETGGRTSAIAIPGSVALPVADASLQALAAAVAVSAEQATRDPSATGENNAIATADALDARAPGADPAPLLASTGAPSAAAARQTLAQPAPLALPADPGAGFDDAFGARIGWMAEQRIGHAELRVTPEHAGPIDVRLQLDGQRVSLEFHSAHAETRQALEASLPRLRDLLGQQGLQLAQADVGQRQAGDGKPAHAAQARGEHDGLAGEPAMPRSIRMRGLLDEYA